MASRAETCRTWYMSRIVSQKAHILDDILMWEHAPYVKHKIFFSFNAGTAAEAPAGFAS
jgi:hypothetical protein